MKIKSEKSPDFLSRLFFYFKNLRIKTFLLIGLSLSSLSVVGMGGIYYGTKLSTSENSAIFASFYRYFRPSLNIPEHFFKGIFSNPEILNINMEYLDYKKISFLVDKSKKNNIISPEYKNEDVNATIDNNNLSYDISLKLRGTYLEHVRSDKWSFRLKVKNDKTLFGMQRFSLSSPETRNHIHEWLFQQALKSEGLINLRYEFVKVNMNGKNLGIYALEEFFDKRLIENNKLREGVIVKPLMKDEQGNLFVYQKNKVLKNLSLKSSYEYLSELLLDLDSRAIPPSQVFDIEKSAKYFALASIFGGQHGHIDINFVCYFNPITNLLEPIGYDSDVSRKIERYGGMLTSKTNAYHDAVFNHSIMKYLFESEHFYKSYIENLNSFIEEKYIEDLIEKNSSQLEHNLNILYKEYYYFDYFERDYLKSNRQYIAKNLKTSDRVFIDFISYESTNQVNLSIDNLKDIKIEIISATIDGHLFVPSKRIITNSTRLDSKKYFSLFKKILDKKSELVDNKLQFKIVGIDKIYSISINNVKSPGSNKKKVNYIKNKQGNVERFDFIEINFASKEIKIPFGNYQLSSDLVIPKNYKFIIEKGTTIDLTNSANIVSYSPIYLIGTEFQPIKIFSTDLSGQGISVINAKEKSFLSNISIAKLSNPNKEGIYLSGSINFYQSPVEIKKLNISNNNSEDALNIIKSDYSISDSEFYNIFSDAFDGDFSDGKIINTKFIDCGNDAIDVSGSIVMIDSIYIENAADKGVSIGENSHLTGSNLTIKKSEIGITSKDLSSVELNNVLIEDTTIGFAAYQKKSEYGPAKITIQNYQRKNIEREYLIELNSTMMVDNNIIQSKDVKVENMLYGNMYGKKSK